MGKYKIHIDPELCVGDGLCCEVAPETFEKDREGNVVVCRRCGDPPESILSAARRCQMDAITVSDADTGEQIWPVD